MVGHLPPIRAIEKCGSTLVLALRGGSEREGWKDEIGE